MWRSVVTRGVSLCKLAARRKTFAIQNPHLVSRAPQSDILISIQFAFRPQFSTWVVSPPKSSSCQNPRHFSHNSSDPICDAESSRTLFPISDSGEDDVFSDSTAVNDENSISVLSESEDPATSYILDETSDTPVKSDDPDEEEGQEVDLKKLQDVLSLLQSSGLEGSLESRLDKLGLAINKEFVVKVLETPVVPGEVLIGFFRWAWNKPEFSVNRRVVDALVQAICRGSRKRDAYSLWDLVKELGEKENGLLSVEILNQLISFLSRLRKGKAGLEVFNKFGEFGCVPNAETYYFTIEALCRRSIYDWASSVCDKMLSEGKLPESEKIATIICYLCKGGKASDAHSVYLLAKEKDRCLPRSSVNCLISYLSREDNTVGLALEMLEDFSEEERKYAIKPYSWVIRGLCRMRDTEGAKKLLLRMVDAGPPPGNAVFNLVINALSKVGDMVEAKKIMELMEDRGLKPDVYTYGVIMSAYAKGGEMEEARKVLYEAKKKHSKLCPVTYHTLIRGYCKLEEFDKALKLFAEMKHYGVKPTVDEYNKLIQSLCLKALDWETAEKLLEEMKENGLHLSGITKGLIRAVKEMVQAERKDREVAVEA